MPRRRELLIAAVTASTLARADENGFARRLSEIYPVNASLGYVTALIWSAQRTLNDGRLPPQSQQALLALRQAAAAEVPTAWPLLAGYAAFAEAARADGDAAAGELALKALRAVIVDSPGGPHLAGLRPWTDDLFMAALLFDRTLPWLPVAERPRATQALAASLLDLTGQLQRADGLFDHAVGSRVAWGRGNGFASLGLALALGGPLSSTQPRLLSSLRAHLLALLALQGPDGLWRQVLDDADSAGELTVTAMNVAALTTARRRGWLRSRHADLAIALAWKGLQSRVDADGGFRDVCASTPAGPTADFYRQRPMLSGRDDRAAAMWLAAAVS